MKDALGTDFKSKVLATFRDDVGHYLWDVQGLLEPGDNALFDWHGNRNDLPVEQLQGYLRLAGLTASSDCTGYADKRQGNPPSCRRRYVREEGLEQQFTALLGRLQFDDEVLAWCARPINAGSRKKRSRGCIGLGPGADYCRYPKRYPARVLSQFEFV